MGFSTGYGASAQYFGHEDYYAAKRGGAKDSDILNFLRGNPGVLRGQNVAGGGGLYDEIYRSSFDETLNSYKEQLESQKKTFESQLTEAQTRMTSLQTERDQAKALAEEAERRANTEKELAVSQQVSSLRTGSTVSGQPGAGLGDTKAGQPGTYRAGEGSGPSILDRAYQEIDPTDSVLDKKVDIPGATDPASDSPARRAEARQRAASMAGGGASSYYSRRFG